MECSITANTKIDAVLMASINCYRLVYCKEIAEFKKSSHNERKSNTVEQD